METTGLILAVIDMTVASCNVLATHIHLLRSNARLARELASRYMTLRAHFAAVPASRLRSPVWTGTLNGVRAYFEGARTELEALSDDGARARARRAFAPGAVGSALDELARGLDRVEGLLLGLDGFAGLQDGLQDLKDAMRENALVTHGEHVGVLGVTGRVGGLRGYPGGAGVAADASVCHDALERVLDGEVGMERLKGVLKEVVTECLDERTEGGLHEVEDVERMHVRMRALEPRVGKAIEALNSSDADDGEKRLLGAALRELLMPWRIEPKWLNLDESSQCLIGTGGSGRVYRGELFVPDVDDEDGERCEIDGHAGEMVLVAIKVLDAAMLRANAGLQLEIVREASLNVLVAHPNIVRFYGMHWPDEAESGGRWKRRADRPGNSVGKGAAPAVALVVTELMSCSLEDVLQERMLPRFEDKIRVLHDVATALAHMHGKHVFHGDVKPKNVLVKVDADERMVWPVKLADLGVSRKRRDVVGELRSRETMLGVGTRLFMAPELYEDAREENSIDMCDVWSFGVLACHLLVDGVNPVSGKSDQWLFDNVRSGDMQRMVCRWAKGIENERVRGVVLRCLVTRAERRPAMREVLHVLAVGEDDVRIWKLQRSAFMTGDSEVEGDEEKACQVMEKSARAGDLEDLMFLLYRQVKKRLMFGFTAEDLDEIQELYGRIRDSGGSSVVACMSFLRIMCASRAAKDVASNVAVLREIHGDNDPTATALLGVLYSVGAGVAENQSLGLKLLAQSAEFENELGLAGIVVCALNGGCSLPQLSAAVPHLVQKARKAVLKKLSAGNPVTELKTLLAWLSVTASGKHDSQSAKELESAANEGCLCAPEQLEVLYREGSGGTNGVIPQLERAAYWRRRCEKVVHGLEKLMSALE